MIYQIFYDERSKHDLVIQPGLITPFGVHHARNLKRETDYIYDDELTPNLTEHNTLCEWRAMYYVWKHLHSNWVGFTSWGHDKKKFQPRLCEFTLQGIESVLSKYSLAGFCVVPVSSLILQPYRNCTLATLKNHFIQYYHINKDIPGSFLDSRGRQLGDYCNVIYWDFIINEFKKQYSIDLEQELDWVQLGKVAYLHTWCNAFVARWKYFDDYMRMFSPIVLAMLDHFGSHPTDLELSYICERLIIIYNYIQYSNMNIITD